MTPDSSTLYLIDYLHQTTTWNSGGYSEARLYLIDYLHQTTTPAEFLLSYTNCILLIIYIKPQLYPAECLVLCHCILLIIYIKPQRRSILSLIFCVLRCPTPDKIRCCALRQSGFDAIFTCENSECQRTDAAYKCIKKIRVAAVFRGGSARSCPRNCGFRRTVGRSRSKEW